MAKELMEIGGFITSGAEIVNHDASLSGNGTVDSPLSVVPGYNETVLWSGTLIGSNGGSVDLSERVINFERIRITYKWNNSVVDDVAEVKEVVGQEGVVSYFDAGYSTNDNNKFRVCGFIDFRTAGKMSIITAGQDSINGNAMGYHGSYGAVYKVVGINRKAQ